jgi:hypothetical protein
MRRCPKCDSVFPSSEMFCELDGTPLVLEVNETNANREYGVAKEVAAGRTQPRPASIWKPVAIVSSAAFVTVIVLFLIFQIMNRPQPTENSNVVASNTNVFEPPPPLRPRSPSPVESVSPSPQPTPSPSVSPSTQAASNSSTPTGVELSSSPISTGSDGKGKSGPVIIRLIDGGTIQADEVWQTGEGWWYRKGTLVALLAANQVKAIEKATVQSPPASSPKP